MGGVIGRHGYALKASRAGSASVRMRNAQSLETHLVLDLADDEPLDPSQVVFAMIRIHLVRGIPPDEMQHCQRSTGMLIRPSREVENVSMVDDQILSGDDPLDEFRARNDPVGFTGR